MSCPSGMPNSGRGGVVASTLRLSLAPRRFRPVRSPWGSVASSISARKPSQTVLQLPVDSPPLELHDGERTTVFSSLSCHVPCCRAFAVCGVLLACAAGCCVACVQGLRAAAACVMCGLDACV